MPDSRPGDDAAAVAYVNELYRMEQAGERTTLVIGPFSAFTMIAALQLATRHPGMTDSQRGTLRDFIDTAKTWLTGTPGEALLAAGDDPANDIERR